MPTKKKTDPSEVKNNGSNDITAPLTLSFEEAMKRLEEIANKLENGQVSLDESLALYEEGIALVRCCNEKLDRAEQKIRILDPNASTFED